MTAMHSGSALDRMAWLDEHHFDDRSGLGSMPDLPKNSRPPPERSESTWLEYCCFASTAPSHTNQIDLHGTAAQHARSPGNPISPKRLSARHMWIEIA